MKRGGELSERRDGTRALRRRLVRAWGMQVGAKRVNDALKKCDAVRCDCCKWGIDSNSMRGRGGCAVLFLLFFCCGVPFVWSICPCGARRPEWETVGMGRIAGKRTVDTRLPARMDAKGDKAMGCTVTQSEERKEWEE